MEITQQDYKDALSFMMRGQLSPMEAERFLEIKNKFIAACDEHVNLQQPTNGASENVSPGQAVAG